MAEQQGQNSQADQQAAQRKLWQKSIELVKVKSDDDRVEKTDTLSNLLASRPEGQQQLAEQVLLQQVEVAKCKEGHTSWLKAMADKLLKLNFQSREWLSAHVHVLPQIRRAVWTEPTGQCGDVRRKENPDLPRTGDHLEVLDAVEEKLLQKSVDEIVMEIDMAIADEMVQPDTPSREWADMVKTPPSSPVVKPKPQSPVKPKPQDRKLEVAKPKPPEHQADTTPPPHKTCQEESEKTAQKDQCAAGSKTYSQAATGGPADSQYSGGYSYRPYYNPQYQRPQHQNPRGRGYWKKGRWVETGGSYPTRGGYRGGYSGPHKDNQDRYGYQHKVSGPIQASQGQSKASPAKPLQEQVKQAEKRPAAAASCLVAGCSVGLDEEHAFLAHLPLLFHPALNGREVAGRRVTALNFLLRVLVGTHKTLGDLVNMAERVCPSVVTERPSPELDVGMRELLSQLQCPPPSNLLLRPTGNGVESLLHWKRLLALVSLLTGEVQREFQTLFEPSELEKSCLPSKPEAFDSHCHLDRTMMKFNLEEPSLQAVLNLQQPPTEHRVVIKNVVGVFCDPDKFPTPKEVVDWANQGVIPAIGWHPRGKVETPEFWSAFQGLLSLKEVVGFGEVGYDLTEHESTWVDQLDRLDRQLSYLGPDHVLVLHGRGQEGQPADPAWLAILYLLRGRPEVGTNRLMHCHCFLGSAKLMSLWISIFPNTYFGFTGVLSKCTESQNPAVYETVRKVAPGRLLVETDAPYFSFHPQRRSTPANIGQVAAVVAKILGRDYKQVLQLTVENARRLYVDRQPPRL